MKQQCVKSDLVCRKLETHCIAKRVASDLEIWWLDSLRRMIFVI